MFKLEEQMPLDELYEWEVFLSDEAKAQEDARKKAERETRAKGTRHKRR